MQDIISIDAIVNDKEGLQRHSDDEGSTPLSLVRQQSLGHGSNDRLLDFDFSTGYRKWSKMEGTVPTDEMREKHIQYAYNLN